MLIINCPFCGARDHSEFSYGGDASIHYPPLDASVESWVDAVFERENPDSRQFETWHHVHGCRMWLVVERDVSTHEIFSVESAHKDIRKALDCERRKNINDDTEL